MIDKNTLTIVTAFFDIGRESWTTENGFDADNRTADTYFEYFSNLAQLENPMVIFTSKEFENRIKQIRGQKTTEIILIDLDFKFKFILEKIEKILNSPEFKTLIPLHQSKKPEYKSSKYILVTNLKPYFLAKVARLNNIKTNLISWIDFGYVRDKKTLNNLKQWRFPFKFNKFHCFTINNLIKQNTKEEIVPIMLEGGVPIIGGALVGSKDTCIEFFKCVFTLQKKALSNNFVDDDQFFFTMSYYERPDLIQLNYLGHNKWFSLFKSYSRKNLMHFYLQYKYLIKDFLKSR